MNCIACNDGHKCQLKEMYTVAVDIRPAAALKSEYVDLTIAMET